MVYTEKKIAEWKRLHGDIFLITVEDKNCILRKPKRKDYSYVSAIKDPIKITEMMVKQLWVEGDEELRDNDDYFLALMPRMEEVMKVKDSEVKKL